MSFPPVVIDTTASTTTTTTTTERPIYVYGQSGRCWKFKNADDAEKYFDRFIFKESCPEFLTDVDYLISRYGESILKRLALITPTFGDLPVITESNFDVDIIYKGKCTHGGLPRKYTYFFKKANISITCDAKYGVYSVEPLYYLFPDNTFHKSISHLTHPFDPTTIELIHDYLLGDRVRYTEPRTHVAQTQSWSFLNIFRKSQSYTPIRVDLHLA